MRRLMAALCVMALAGGTVAIATTTPTSAAPDGGNSTYISGGDGNETNPRAATATELAQDEAKGAVAEAAHAARHGTGSVEEYDKARRAYAKRFPDAPAFEPLGIITAPLTANRLTLDHIGQKTSWWCGPATASMMIKQMYMDGEISTTRSQYGDRPKRGQKALSKSAYLDAVDDGTYRTDMRRGLNRWIGNSYYSVLSSPTVNEFRTRLAQDIDTGWSLAVAALEPASSSYRYNGHPAGVKVDHWVPAYGYKDDLDTTRFADSSTTLWSGVSPKFTHNTEKFVKRYVKPAKAIVW